MSDAWLRRAAIMSARVIDASYHRQHHKLRPVAIIRGWSCVSAAISLPLDRARRLARHVIDHAVDAFDLVDDAGRDVADELRVEGIEVGGHAIGRGDRA